MKKKLVRQRRAFDRLCARLPKDLGKWTFSQRMEYFKLSNFLNLARTEQKEDR
jgi:hypothetical protein